MHIESACQLLSFCHSTHTLQGLHHIRRRHQGKFSKVFTGRTKTKKRCISQSEILQLKALPLQPGYSLRFAAYPKDSFKGKKSITIEELMQAVKESDAKILQTGLSGVGIVYYYGLYDDDNAAFVDWEKGESHLTDYG